MLMLEQTFYIKKYFINKLLSKLLNDIVALKI